MDRSPQPLGCTGSQLAFAGFGAPTARRDDRETSIEAGRAQSEQIGRNRVRMALWDVVQQPEYRYGFTGPQVAHDPRLSDFYEVTVIRRISDLVAEGLVIDTGRRGRSPRNRPVIVWAVAP